jgi:cysteine synthase A
MPLQFENEANPEIHRRTTALEIIKDFPEGIDILITGVGTGGHISGTAEILKKEFPQLKVFAVEPIDSPVISGGKPGPHALQGIGAGFIPKNLNTKILDGAISVSKEEAYLYTQRLAKEEGILAGISTGATMAAISKKIDEVESGKTILGFNYDTGERYLTVDGLF